MLNIPDAVKDLFKTDGVLKNIRISFPNGEKPDICNDRLVKESLKFDESISSRPEIHFGLCESSQISFECVDIGNIKGMDIDVYIEIDTSSCENDPEVVSETAPDVPFPFYRVPLGRFIIDECKRDAGMTMRKVTAYSKFMALSMPRYTIENNPNEYIGNFNVLNYLVACGDFFDYDNFTVLPLTGLSWTDSVYIFRHNWEYNGAHYECTVNLSYSTAYTNEHLLNNQLNFNGLIRCDDNGYSDSDRQEIEDIIDGYIADWKDSAEVSGTPDDLFISIKNLVRNALRPVPYYFNEIPYSYFMGVEVGDIYATNGFLYFFKGITINVTADSEDALNYSYQSSKTPDNVDYKEIITDSEVYPRIFMSLKGEATVYGYSHFLKLLEVSPKILTEAYAEILGYFGKMGRDGKFGFLRLAQINVDGQFPNHDLLPSTSVYPKPFDDTVLDTSDIAIIGEECMISLWYEEYFIHFGKIICTYYSNELLDESGYPTETIYEYEWDSSKDALTYDISNNVILKNSFYPSNMGGYSEADIKDMLEPLITALKALKFYPQEMSCVGLPYIEAGDWILASYHGNKVLGLALSRTLGGIQSLRDKMKSK